MKQFNSVALVGLMSFLCPFHYVCKAETKVPCFVLYGIAEKEHCIDLDFLNRITFGNNSMIITSSKDSSHESSEWLYSSYHHIEIKEANPSNFESSVNTIFDDSGFQINFDEQTKLLHLTSTFETKYQIGIFSVNGSLLLTSELSNGETITLTSLPKGIYIAVATDGKYKYNLKFILN